MVTVVVEVEALIQVLTINSFMMNKTSILKMLPWKLIIFFYLWTNVSKRCSEQALHCIFSSLLRHKIVLSELIKLLSSICICKWCVWPAIVLVYVNLDGLNNYLFFFLYLCTVFFFSYVIAYAILELSENKYACKTCIYFLVLNFWQGLFYFQNDLLWTNLWVFKM